MTARNMQLRVLTGKLNGVADEAQDDRPSERQFNEVRYKVSATRQRPKFQSPCNWVIPSGVPVGNQERAFDCYGLQRAATACNVRVRVIAFSEQQVATDYDGLPRC